MFKSLKKFSTVAVTALLLVACGGADDEAGTADESEMGDPVPELSLMTSLPEDNQMNYEAAGDIGDAWEELGIDVNVEPIDFNAKSDRLRSDSQDFDAFVHGWSGRIDRIDPDMYIHAIFHSSNADPGGNNFTGYTVDEYDALADAQRQEMDQEKRKEIIFEAQEMLADDIPMIPLYFRDLVFAYNNEKFDNFTVMAGEGIFNEWMPMEVEPVTDEKTLRIASTQDLNSLNPFAATTVYEWRNLRLIYDKLLRLSPAGEPEAAAATEWEVIDDTTVEITLREDMTFHDGEPVTVDDVKFSYDYFIEHEAGYFIAFLESIESTEVVDDETVQFNLKEPYAPFVNVTLTQIPILPKHLWENLLEEEGIDHPEEYTNEDPIGSGPFVFDEWRRDEHLRTTTFEDFYKDIAIDGYSYDIYGQDEAIITALETETADVNSDEFIPANIERAQELDFLTIEEVPAIGFQYLSYNMRGAPFDDKAFRQAIAHTVDYDTIVEVFLDGYGLNGGAGLVISPANEFWHHPDIERPTYDLEKAREILEEAGYTWDSDGKLRMPVDMATD